MAAQPKRDRGTKKSIVTRQLKTLNRHLIEEDAVYVISSLDKLKIAFDAFEKFHYNCHDVLDDSTEIEKSERYFAAAECNYMDGDGSARAWLKSIKTRDVYSKQNNDEPSPPVLSQKEMLNLLSAPKVELDIFTGDPLLYQTFMAVFEEAMDTKFSDAQTKLTRLL